MANSPPDKCERKTLAGSLDGKLRTECRLWKTFFENCKRWLYCRRKFGALFVEYVRETLQEQQAKYVFLVNPQRSH